MTQVITIAGERLFAQKAQANEQLDIDTFIFANVAGQDPNAPIDREEGVPTADIVHQQAVQQAALMNENAVVYSSVLDSVTGPFEFNWVGLYSSANQTLVAISHIPTVTKTVTVPGASGNTLNRNFAIEYSGIAELTGITVAPETWQLDFTARLSGMDELTRQLAADMNGKDWFIGDGFKVVPRATVNTFSVTPGVGYVSGLRIEQKQEKVLILQSYPQFVYVDAWFDGTNESVWKGQTAFTVTNTEMDDYIDVNGKQHYVFKLAVINAANDVEDLRNVDGLLEKIEKSKIRTTIDEIKKGKYTKIGTNLTISDRNNAEAIIKYGEADDIEFIHAAAGIVAEIQPVNEVYYASHLGATYDSEDSSLPINRAMEKSNYKVDGEFSISKSLLVKNNTVGDWLGSKIKPLSDNFDVITANNKHNFHLLNKPKIIGPGMGVGTGTGIVVLDCWGYTLDQPEVSALGNSIIVDGTAVAPGGLEGYRGRQGKIINSVTYNCKYGPQILRRAEYTLWINPQSTQCSQIGWIQEAGNTNVVCGNIQDNQNGVLVKESASTNANHGMFNSVNINHNIGYNVRCENVTLGHTFNGCHIYGDSEQSGTIELIKCSGINFTDGIIDAKIILDGDVEQTLEKTGWNRFSGNQMDENFTDVESINNGREKTIFKDNFRRNGDAWGINDRAFIEARATAETSAQNIQSNTTTTIEFPKEKSDNRGYYDEQTSRFTTAQACSLQVEYNLQIVISEGSFVDGFAAVYVNNIPLAIAGLIPTNQAGTSLVASGHLTTAVLAGSTVEVRVNVESTTGTISVVPDAATNVSFISTN